MLLKLFSCKPIGKILIDPSTSHSFFRFLFPKAPATMITWAIAYLTKRIFHVRGLVRHQECIREILAAMFAKTDIGDFSIERKDAVRFVSRYIKSLWWRNYLCESSSRKDALDGVEVTRGWWWPAKWRACDNGCASLLCVCLGVNHSWEPQEAQPMGRPKYGNSGGLVVFLGQVFQTDMLCK